MPAAIVASFLYHPSEMRYYDVPKLREGQMTQFCVKYRILHQSRIFFGKPKPGKHYR